MNNKKEEAIKILQKILEEWVQDDDISIVREEALRFAIDYMKEAREKEKMTLDDLLNTLEKEASIKIIKDQEIYHGWVDDFYEENKDKELLNARIKYIMQYPKDLIILI